MQNDFNERVGALLSAASAEIGRLNFGRAEELLKQAESADRENPEVLFSLALVLFRTTRYSEAEKVLHRIKALPFTTAFNAEIEKLLLFTLLEQQKLTESAPFLIAATQRYENDPVILNMLGYYYEKIKNYEKARTIYERVLKISPNNATAQNSLAYLLALSGGDLNSALHLARLCCSRSPENPAYNDTLGYIYFKLNNTELAKKHLLKALKKMPDSETVKTHLNMLLKI